MELQLKIIGYVLILLAAIHVFFPKRFEWKKELAGLSLLNNQMMYVHTFFVGLTVFLMGILCIYCSEQLNRTNLGGIICLGLSIFWLARLIIQFFVYSPKLWRGKKFETTVHIIFSMMWTYFAVLFYLVYYYGKFPDSSVTEMIGRF
jgi:uncharacterized membrane protein